MTHKKTLAQALWFILGVFILVSLSGCFCCMKRKGAMEEEKPSLKGTAREMGRGGVNMTLCWLELPHEIERSVRERDSIGPFGLVANAFRIAFGTVRGAVWSAERCAGGAVEIALSPFPPYEPIMDPAYPPYVKQEKKIEHKDKCIGEEAESSFEKKGVKSNDSCSTETSILDEEGDSFETTGGTHKKIITRNIPLAGEAHLSVSNINGDVRISSWENPEIVIQAEKIMTVDQGKGRFHIMRSKLPFASREEAEEYFARLKFKITEEQNNVKIETIHPRQHKKNVNLSMNYDVRVPRKSHLKIENSNGGIYVEGTEGSVNLSTVNGRIECQEASGDIKAEACNGSIVCKNTAGSIHANTVNGSITIKEPEDLSSREAIECESVNGGITVSLQEGSSFDLEAQSVNGGFQSDFPLEIEKMLFAGTIKTRVGEGGPRIKLESVNGSIRINKI